MTDFLTRLVGRSRGTKPEVQPLIPSFFAPVRESLPFFSSSGEERIAESESSMPLMEYRRPSVTTQSSEKDVEAAPHFGDFERNAETATSQGHIDRDVTPPPSITPLPDQHLQAPQEIASKNVKDSPGTLPHLREEHENKTSQFDYVSPLPRDLKQASLQEAEKTVRKREEVTSLPTSPVQMKLRPTIITSNAQSEPRNEKTPRQPEPMPPLWSKLAERIEQLESRRAQIASEKEPKTVKVTIGRIEVRAVMPAPAIPQKRTVQSAPKLSLDDYLRERDGGKR